jgi:hypothetical protein
MQDIFVLWDLNIIENKRECKVKKSDFLPSCMGFFFLLSERRILDLC